MLNVSCMEEKMKIVTKILLAISFVAFSPQSSAEAIRTGTHYVIAESLNVRTAPSANSDIARKLSKGSKVEVFELKKGWARVTDYIELTQTEKAALWVSAKYLSDKIEERAKCKVLDVDTSKTYSGGCKNGLAHGKGVAKGRDFYRGSFVNGNNHGYGVYEWGPKSDWARDRYEGEWNNGERTGYGVYEWGPKSDWARDRYEGEWNNGERTGYGEYSSNNKLANSKVEKGRYVQRGLFSKGRFTHICESKNNCQKITDTKTITKSQLKKLMGDAILKSIELDDSSIPVESRGELGVCLSDIFLGSILDDGKSAYTEDELNSLLPELQSKMMINMLGLSLDKEGLLRRIEKCSMRSVKKGFKNVSFNSLVLNMEDFKYENIKVSGNGLFMVNQFVLRNDAGSTNMIMVNVDSLENKTEILDKCSNPMQGCEVVVYGRVENDDYENILEARIIELKP